MRLIALAASVAVWLVGSGIGHAAGLQTLEQGTWDMGRALVGASSAADSAATAFYNPAGMTLLDKPQFSAGLMGVFGNSEFDPGSGNTIPGGDGGNQMDNTVVPGGVFGVYPVTDDLRFGASFTVPFAGILDPDDNWVGRYQVQKLELLSMRVTPSAAYRVNDWLSVGGGVGFNYTSIDLRVAVPLPGPGDGRIRVRKAYQWEVNFTAGLLLEPRESTRLSATYFSRVDNDKLRGRLSSLAGPGFSPNVDLALTLPQAVAVGIREELTDDLVLYVDGLWADFSDFDSIDVSTTLISAGVDTNFKDVWGGGMGLEYALDPQWTLLTGASYASSPVEDHHRVAAIPFDRQIRLGLGTRYKWREDVTVGLAYEFLDMGSNRINQTSATGTLHGKYNPAHVHFVALSLNKTF